jgi:hypothetical protein
MRVYRIENFTGGWFVGDFTPTAYSTTACEVCHKVHLKDETWPAHVHRTQVEINCVIRGHLTVNDHQFGPGDIFIIDPGEPATATFPEDTELIIVKIPSMRDKHLLEPQAPSVDSQVGDPQAVDS